ncbi:MAG: acetamidase/formamidase family protein [Bacillota bacterium]
MSYNIDDENVIYNFSSKHKAVVEIEDKSEIEVSTDDCFRSQLQKEEDSLDELDWERINPATGPIYIKGAKPGDILAVDIKEIEVGGQAVMIAAPGEGVIGDRLKKSTTKILPVENNQLKFNDDIYLPLEPMIGVIGTAPAEGSVPNGTPDYHGGNMDCKRIKAGSTLYLPVEVEGALLAMGDFHALMGDGEIVVCGAECRGRAKLKVEVIKDKELPLPLVEDSKRISTIASAKTLDRAVKDATDNMVDFLRDYHNFELAEAGMFLSLVGDARICQVVDPQQTARFELEKKYLKNNKNLREALS